MDINNFYCKDGDIFILGIVIFHDGNRYIAQDIHTSSCILNYSSYKYSIIFSKMNTMNELIAEQYHVITEF